MINKYIFFSIMFTMYLAFSNEVGSLSPNIILDIPTMVSLHGLINGLVALPALSIAIIFDRAIHWVILKPRAEYATERVPSAGPRPYLLKET